ncbi:AAA family ATPase [Frankia sp. Cppng1_Ct_nod]|uniref:AAA family ATPase n=1 Tax=Frankia sp. Cppng1_Ct_nod TaxID=2897162 RepID=UPI001F5EE5A8|nr:AAA family ATPase [Frankia sp. Cppng1_Ct_nod]
MNNPETFSNTTVTPPTREVTATGSSLPTEPNPHPAEAPDDATRVSASPTDVPAADAPAGNVPAADAPAGNVPAADAPATGTQARPGVPDDPEAARRALIALRDEVGKAVVGQDAAVSGLVVTLLCRGHALLEGVPGVAKTLLVRALAAALSLDTKRLQFTPDLMPGDVTGSLVYDARTSQFAFRQGPVFTNLLLADEINRTPPKTQAALLEAMEERQVSVDGSPRRLPVPFAVIATQNPIEHEGTYQLPEAQLDRFLLKLAVSLPPRDDEIRVLARHSAGFDPSDLGAAGIRPVAGPSELAVARRAMGGVQIHPEILGYIVDLVRATRAAPSVQLGVSPRGATALLATTRAWAWLSGRTYATPDDVKALARPTLRHRIALRPEAELEGVTADTVLNQVLATVPVPR